MDKLTPNLTEEQIKANIDSLVSQKADSSYIQSYIDNYKSDGRGGYVLKNQPVQQETPSVASEVKNAVSDTFVKPFTDRMSAVAGRAPNQSSVSTALQTVGAVAGGVSDIATTGLIEGAKVFTPKMVEDKISEYANKAGVTIAGKIPDSAKQFLADHPEALANAQAFIDIASVIPALKPVGQALAKGSKIGAEAAAIAGKNTAETISTVMTPSEKSLESKILTTFQKGVKPSIAGKKTTANVAQYKDNVISGVKTIKENAPNLTFTTDSGEAIIGQTPKTLQQFSDAIEQTKKSVFAKYDELAKKAGSAGVAVDVAPIARELDTVINDKALSITNPRAIQYAKDLQDRLIKTGKLDAVTAQDVIQQYNKSLEAFYRNPSYDTASQAAIDAAVANNMRKVLDNGITGLTGTEYGALKKQYGALKSIEQDVIKATLRDARKNTKGLIDFTDILSGSQLTHGLLTMNPATISSGLVSKGIATIHKTLNDPNRAISKMFDAASKIDKAKNASKIELNRGIIELNPKNWFEEVGNSADVGLKAKTKDLQLEMAQEAARTMRNHGVSVEVPTVKNAVQILEQARDIARKKKVSDVVKDVMPSEKMKPFLEPKKKVVSSLEQEAKKYKSAEEFVKAQKEIYHGGAGVDALKNDVNILSPEEKLKMPSSGGGNIGLSTTDNKNYAIQYSQSIGGRNDVATLYINPKAKIYDIGNKHIDEFSSDELTKLAEKYDVIKSSEENEYRIITKNGAVTKSQLTDIWNKAHGK